MKAAVMVGWNDVPHLTADAKASILASVPPWQREARSKGIPDLGPGAIYPIPESQILCEPFPIPMYYPRAYGFDVGWNRTAAIWGAQNPDSGVWYLYDEYYRGQKEPSIHALAIQKRGTWIPGAIDPASRGRGQKDGEQLLQNYLDLGLLVEIADNTRESGIFNVWEALSQGMLKVFPHCRNWFSEYRIYRRDEKGQVVKKNDHLMDCTRYFWQTGRGIAKRPPPSEGVPGQRWWDWNAPDVWSG